MSSPILPICSPLAVCVLPEPAPNSPRPVRFGHYVHEILQHAGLCYQAVDLPELGERLEEFRLLVTVGEAALPEGLQARLPGWVAEGGAWLSVGGLCGMGELLGASYQEPRLALWGGSLALLGEGYLVMRH